MHIYLQANTCIIWNQERCFPGNRRPHPRGRLSGMISEESLNLNAIAENFDVTRQAVSLHIKILNECGLIVIRQKAGKGIVKHNLKN